MTLTRRAAVAGLSFGALARPASAQGTSGTLRFIPQSDLSSLDPIWTTGYVAHNYGYMVFDTLYALGSAFRVRPQMAEEHSGGGRAAMGYPAARRPALPRRIGSPALCKAVLHP